MLNLDYLSVQSSLLVDDAYSVLHEVVCSDSYSVNILAIFELESHDTQYWVSIFKLFSSKHLSTISNIG